MVAAASGSDVDGATCDVDDVCDAVVPHAATLINVNGIRASSRAWIFTLSRYETSVFERRSKVLHREVPPGPPHQSSLDAHTDGRRGRWRCGLLHTTRLGEPVRESHGHEPMRGHDCIGDSNEQLNRSDCLMCIMCA